MEMELKKESFLDGITKLRNIENRQPVKRSDGFVYLHDMITVRLAYGQKFSVGDLDFSKFTEDDLTDYVRYYQENLEPKIQKVSAFFEIVRRAAAVFSTGARYYCGGV